MKCSVPACTLEAAGFSSLCPDHGREAGAAEDRREELEKLGPMIDRRCQVVLALAVSMRIRADLLCNVAECHKAELMRQENKLLRMLSRERELGITSPDPGAVVDQVATAHGQGQESERERVAIYLAEEGYEDLARDIRELKHLSPMAPPSPPPERGVSGISPHFLEARLPDFGSNWLDTHCPVCGCRQFTTSAGISCPGGHGGIEGVPGKTQGEG